MAPSDQARKIFQREVADLYASGKSIADIADQLGVGFKRTRNALIAAGVKRRKPGAMPSSSPGHELLRRLYVDDRKSTRQIAPMLNVTTTTVRLWLKSAGIKMRTIAEGKKGQKPKPHTIEASVRSRRKYSLPNRPPVGYKIDGYGYVLIWTDAGYVREHRKVMEEMLGRPLEPQEDVHHKNGVRTDNRPENLELMANRSEHQRHHADERRRRVDGTFAPNP